jgi:hypothetical protein
LEKLDADKEEKEKMAAKIRVLEEENNVLKQKLTEKRMINIIFLVKKHIFVLIISFFYSYIFFFTQKCT